MLSRFFRRDRANRRVTVDAIYERIVAAARQPRFYADWQVPDTPLGRFEMVALHVFLFLHRLKGSDEAARDLTQEVTDEFFRDVEHSLRELGIGDMGVPKRMKKLAGMFYGRAAAYEAAIEAADQQALAASLSRNVMPEAGDWAGSEKLAAYVLAASHALAAQEKDQILAGRLAFPVADEEAA